MASHQKKRKCPPDDEIKTEPTSSSMSVYSVGRKDELPARKCEPTMETQELYDKVRRIQDGTEPDDHLQYRHIIPGLCSEPMDTEFLPLPSHSRSPTSPSPSCASTTYSLTQAMSGAGLDEDRPRKKQRAKRGGPLDPLDRAQAALMRKIGACSDCKLRKVKCIHFEREPFERAYQLEKMTHRGSPVNPGPPPTAGPSRPGADPSFSLVGSWQSSVPPQPYHKVARDLDNILQANAATPVETAGPVAPYYAADPSRLLLTNHHSVLFADAHLGASSIPPPTPLSPLSPPSPLAQLTDPFPTGLVGTFSDAGSASLIAPITQSGNPMPIGMTSDGRVWECRHGDDANNPTLYGVCNQRFLERPDLFTHFELVHGPFTVSYAMWRCKVLRCAEDGVSRVCGFMYASREMPCLQCGGSLWERWWFGSASRTPSLTSGPSVPVSSQDGSALGGGYGYPPRSQYLNQGQFTDYDLLFPGRYPGGNQGGGYQSSAAESAKGRMKGHCFRRVHMYPGGCLYFRGFHNLMLASGNSDKAPFLLIFFVLSLLLLVNDQLMVQLTSAESRRIATAVLEILQGIASCTSLLFILAGLVWMWFFKHVRFRRGHDIDTTFRHQRCRVRELFGLPPPLGVEDTGSVWGCHEGIRT